MEMQKIREMSNEDLRKEIHELEGNLLKQRMQNRIGTAENPVAARYMKKDIARMKTALREREPGAKS